LCHFYIEAQSKFNLTAQVNINPFPNKQLILDGHRVKTSLLFWFAFHVLFGMQNDQPASSSPADRLHPRQNMESELK